MHVAISTEGPRPRKLDSVPAGGSRIVVPVSATISSHNVAPALAISGDARLAACPKADARERQLVAEIGPLLAATLS